MPTIFLTVPLSQSVGGSVNLVWLKSRQVSSPQGMEHPGSVGEQLLDALEQNVCNCAYLWDELWSLRSDAHSFHFTAQKSVKLLEWQKKNMHKVSKFITNTKAGFKLWSLQRGLLQNPPVSRVPTSVFWAPSSLQRMPFLGTAGKSIRCWFGRERNWGQKDGCWIIRDNNFWQLFVQLPVPGESEFGPL